MKAIVIDDSRSMRRILGKTLISLGFEVLEAEHGQAGLDRLDASRGMQQPWM
ncbi:MAG: two-component system chemotaxis response regulator CheY [Myxococcota bacterium]|jgi:two-component system chemotaxis response regulator CheY